jgi:hypothetical protein
VCPHRVELREAAGAIHERVEPVGFPDDVLEGAGDLRGAGEVRRDEAA